MKSLNKYIKESILDNEDILIGSAKDNMIGQTIYNKLVSKKKLTKDELEWIESNIGIFKVDKEQLRNLIINLNIHNISLNWLDVSDITDMSYMFYRSEFNGDVSKWNTSKVKDMSHMFNGSIFNSDMSKWDVSKVEDMSFMFYYSDFSGDISKWDVSNAKDMSSMFEMSKFNKDISKWDVSNAKDMTYMFANSRFNRDISKWDVSKVKGVSGMLDDCPIKEKYKPKFK